MSAEQDQKPDTPVTVKIRIGLTRTDRVANYVPASDGYRPGAAQDIIELDVEPSTDSAVKPKDWAEAAYVATNAPVEVFQPEATAVARGIRLADRNGIRFRALSKGDTVEVDGEVWACAAGDWELVVSNLARWTAANPKLWRRDDGWVLEYVHDGIWMLNSPDGGMSYKISRYSLASVTAALATADVRIDQIRTGEISYE